MHSIIIDAFVTSSHSIQWPFGGNKFPGFAAAVRLHLFPVSGRINFVFCSVEMVMSMCQYDIPLKSLHHDPEMQTNCFGWIRDWGEQTLPLYNKWIFVTKNFCCISPAVSNGLCGIQEWFPLRSSIISFSTGWIWQNYTLPIRRDVHFFEDIRPSIRWL